MAPGLGAYVSLLDPPPDHPPHVGGSHVVLGQLRPGTGRRAEKRPLAFIAYPGRVDVGVFIFDETEQWESIN
jgi:hypothetical protein